MRIETRTEGEFSISLDEIVTWFHARKLLSTDLVITNTVYVQPKPIELFSG